MSDAEKVAAFDQLASALTTIWHDGRWTWWNPTPSCGTATPRATQEEAIADLVAWGKRMAYKKTRPMPIVRLL